MLHCDSAYHAIHVWQSRAVPKCNVTCNQTYRHTFDLTHTGLHHNHSITFVINVCVLVFFAFLLRMRLVMDICEPLLAFALGYSSPRGKLLVRNAFRGLDSAGYARMWIVEERGGEVAVCEKETVCSVEFMAEGSLQRRVG
jgi:hypothetical protein